MNIAIHSLTLMHQFLGAIRRYLIDSELGNVSSSLKDRSHNLASLFPKMFQIHHHVCPQQYLQRDNVNFWLLVPQFFI